MIKYKTKNGSMSIEEINAAFGVVEGLEIKNKPVKKHTCFMNPEYNYAWKR